MTFRPTALPFCAAALFLAAAPALAQQFKPGLWETNNKIGAGSGQLQGMMELAQQQLAGMNPEQRARIDATLARQGVVLSGDGVLAKVCITPQMAERQQLPIQQNGNCTYQHAKPVGNSMAFSFSCTDPRAAGEGTATFSGPTAYTATMRVTTNATGATETVNIDSRGRWLAADCGAVKPLELPPAR